MFEWSDIFTVGILVVLEGLLSADNAMVMAVMVLGLPEGLRNKALQYGLIGAFVFRIVTTMVAVWLIRLAFAKLVGGSYLVYLSGQHFREARDSESRKAPVTAKSWLGLSPFWATVVKVELMNLVFSIDSILAAVAMSPKFWVVLAGGILGIAGLRVVVGYLLALIQRYPALVDGAFIIIAWVGIKLLIEYLHSAGYIAVDVPQWLSIGIIVLIFLGSLEYARRDAVLHHVGGAEAVASVEDPARAFGDDNV